MDGRIVIIPQNIHTPFSRRNFPTLLRRERGCQILLMTGHQDTLPPTIGQLFTDDLPRWFLATVNPEFISVIKPYCSSEWGYGNRYGEVLMTIEDYIHLKLSI